MNDEGTMCRTVCTVCNRDIVLKEKKDMLRGILRDYSLLYEKYSELNRKGWIKRESVYSTFKCKYQDVCVKYEDILNEIYKYEKYLEKLIIYLVEYDKENVGDILEEIQDVYPILCESARVYLGGM